SKNMPTAGKECASAKAHEGCRLARKKDRDFRTRSHGLTSEGLQTRQAVPSSEVGQASTMGLVVRGPAVPQKPFPVQRRKPFARQPSEVSGGQLCRWAHRPQPGRIEEEPGRFSHVRYANNAYLNSLGITGGSIQCSYRKSTLANYRGRLDCFLVRAREEFE